MQVFMEVDGDVYVCEELDRDVFNRYIHEKGLNVYSCDLCGLCNICSMKCGRVHKDSEEIQNTCAKISIGENIATPHIWIKCGKVQKPVPEKESAIGAEENFGKTGPVRRSARNKSASRVRKSNRRSKVR